MRIENAVREWMTRRLDGIYQKKLEGKKVSYHDWVEKEEQGYGEETRLEARTGKASRQNFVLFLQRRGRLHPRAIEWIEAAFDEKEECLILYGDEDVMGRDGVRRTPWYKPCWSPDLYLDSFYTGSVTAVRRDFASPFLSREEMERGEVFFTHPEEVGGRLDAIFSAAGGFEKGCRSILRLPRMLFQVQEEACFEEYLTAPSRLSLTGKAQDALVSVIIPSKDNPEVLEKCLESLQECGARQKMEIIVVDNGSSPQNRQALERLTQGMRYLYHPMEFHFSAMCNLGVEQARGELLLFLNDDIQVCGWEWMEQMRKKAALPYVGAVGLKLRYPDGRCIQHAGVFNLYAGPAHMLHYLDDEKTYYFGRNRLNYNCAAVTGACLMIERKKYLEVGGFPQELRVAYNDVDLGFSLCEAGYQNVVVNHSYALHYESLSRGNDEEDPEKKKRLKREWETLYRRHPGFQGTDPYFPDLLDPKHSELEIIESDIRPAYEMKTLNAMQKPCWRKFRGELSGYREDPCMLVRLDVSGPKWLRGYAVVLWDDNACYKKYLLLESEQEPDKRLYMRLESQYRYELERNLPDQRNVALSGFWISRLEDRIPPGTYRVGVLATHRFRRIKLVGWSGKCLCSRESDGNGTEEAKNARDTDNGL